ncbi:MAG: DEAD/DEAH box helicase family protein [Gemmatimonadaceae bacterium]
MARITRRAYQAARASDELVVPRRAGQSFMRARNREGRPLLDGVRAADAPAPRRLEPERCRLEEPPLYEYQEAALRHLCDGPLGEAARAAGHAVAYLQMDTGLGKTRLGCAAIARLGEPALIVVPTEAIGEQWVDEFAEILPRLSVALYRNPPKGSRRVPPGPATHDVVVVIVNTFRDKPPEFLDGYGTVVLDEAHEYHSEHNGRALWLAQAAHAVLGLSATPLERPDGLDRYVALHLGPPILPKTIPGFDVEAAKFRGAVRVVEYAGDPRHCETVTGAAGTMSAILTIGGVTRDRARTRAVAAEAVRLYRLHETATFEELAELGLGPRPVEASSPKLPAGEVRRHGVFVFAEHREYLPALRDALRAHLRADEEVLAPELPDGESPPSPKDSKSKPGESPPNGDSKSKPGESPPKGDSKPDISLLRGGVARGEVAGARRAGSHIVLTTYGFSRRGISLPDMTAIVTATPRRNGQRQILGRILRRGSDESIVRQVVDFVDVRTGLRGQYADRRRIYLEKKYPIQKVSVSYEDYPEGAAPSAAAPGAAAPETEDEFATMSVAELLAAALGDDETEAADKTENDAAAADKTENDKVANKTENDKVANETEDDAAAADKTENDKVANETEDTVNDVEPLPEAPPRPKKGQPPLRLQDRFQVDDLSDLLDGLS